MGVHYGARSITRGKVRFEITICPAMMTCQPVLPPLSLSLHEQRTQRPRLIDNVAFLNEVLRVMLLYNNSLCQQHAITELLEATNYAVSFPNNSTCDTSKPNCSAPWYSRYVRRWQRYFVPL